MHQQPPKTPLLRSTNAANASHVDSSRALTVYVASATKPQPSRASRHASAGRRTADNDPPPDRSSVDASTEEAGVATARFVKTGITPDEYDQMRERLGVGDTPPAGGVFHAAAVGEDGKIRVFEVWDSREQAEAWGEKVQAVRTEAGFGAGPPSIEYLEVHKVVQR